MKKTIRTAAALLAAALMLPALPLHSEAAEVKAVRTYNGSFTDVSEKDWFYDSVAGAYSLGLISGVSDTKFNPSGTLKLSETIKLAAMCHQLLVDGKTDESAFTVQNAKNWYDGYVSYAKKHDIVTEDYENYSAGASRAQVAVLFSRAVTSSGVETENLNEVGSETIKDVPANKWYAGAVFKMYRWGIMTGDSSGNMNPDKTVKRSEISAILERIFYPEKRVGASSDSVNAGTSSDKTASSSEEPAKSGASSEVIYAGSKTKLDFTGVTSFAGRFSVSGGKWQTDAGLNLDGVCDIVLENDNISFKLYKDYGYEALGIIRGWLNDSAVGVNGKKSAEISDKYSSVNELFYIYFEGERQSVSQLWYANHGDYTTYAFYFNSSVDIDSVSVVELLCGKQDTDTLVNNSLGELAENIESSGKLTYDGALSGGSDAYKAALEDAKSSAEIGFEESNSRCTILYGRGLYGRDLDEYRLVFIYPDGTVQTICTQKLSNIKLTDGILYYAFTAPDGKMLVYGVNFG